MGKSKRNPKYVVENKKGGNQQSVIIKIDNSDKNKSTKKRRKRRSTASEQQQQQVELTPYQSAMSAINSQIGLTQQFYRTLAEREPNQLPTRVEDMYNTVMRDLLSQKQELVDQAAGPDGLNPDDTLPDDAQPVGLGFQPSFSQFDRADRPPGPVDFSNVFPEERVIEDDEESLSGAGIANSETQTEKRKDYEFPAPQKYIDDFELLLIKNNVPTDKRQGKIRDYKRRFQEAFEVRDLDYTSEEDLSRIHAYTIERFRSTFNKYGKKKSPAKPSGWQFRSPSKSARKSAQKTAQRT